MSCISLRLPPARKAWKSLTSTLGKLHKIRRSKTMKKPRKHLKKTSTTPSTRTPKFLATRRSQHKKLASVRSVIFSFYKKPAPVYIDKLFKEPSSGFVEHSKPQIALNRRVERTPKLRCEAAGKEEEVAGTSKGGGCCDKPCSSDDMWESLALASPLMHGIDERAEEFIARFRGEMAAQEMLARNL